ncbi:hypothetical protein D8674_032348 [Pyrus ussuriensis x Pyrus communis]|uniref:No apical meristem-associated C-terminal domain-containing protein n=1 Tax=Pyrus ussuriensis x Pyrus communis TaxID=2448454 RepID=A0A5N5F196_9ROSA|nr:hypothetical protein D8674_032348 [Pyrus ussuriensis x Pyrus communis]
MASSTMKGRAWSRKEDEAPCKAYRWVSEDSVKGNCQTNDGVWTRKHLQPSLNKWHQALLAIASRHESDTNYYNKVLFEDPPQHIAPTLVFGTASSVADMDEDGSPTIQQIRVENPSSGEGSIPRAMGRNKARRLKEKVKANADYAAQHEVVASLRLMIDQNALEAEERKCRHEERAKQIQEEMDDKNMERITSNYTPMSKTYFDRKKKKKRNYGSAIVLYL